MLAGGRQGASQKDAPLSVACAVLWASTWAQLCAQEAGTEAKLTAYLDDWTIATRSKAALFERLLGSTELEPHIECGEEQLQCKREANAEDWQSGAGEDLSHMLQFRAAHPAI